MSIFKLIWLFLILSQQHRSFLNPLHQITGNTDYFLHACVFHFLVFCALGFGLISNCGIVSGNDLLSCSDRTVDAVAQLGSSTGEKRKSLIRSLTVKMFLYDVQ